MADWRQIQARIRKAKTGTNPTEKLAELYLRTRDAMVAFELARFHEKNGENSEAAKWYTTAAQHFRRAQWRVKAEEALTRLGAPIPPPLPPAGLPGEEAPEDAEAESEDDEAAPSAESKKETMEPVESMNASSESSEQEAQPEGAHAYESPVLGGPSGAPAEGQAPGTHRRRRRGRRGGRNRRRGAATAAGAPPTQERASGAPGSGLPASRYAQPPSQTPPAASEPEEHEAEAPPRRGYTREPMQESPAPPAASGHAWQGARGRGEPALASRMAQLESQLRRLLACPLSALADADSAPAGPGVLLLSDSDQVTHYYVEACQTLRIGIGNLLRGNRGGKSSGRLKQEMADNLGIGESSVSKYLKDHCAVRWLQLDEGAGELAHFVLAVLRPVVKD